MSNETRCDHYDVIVVGAGPGGSAAAYYLQQQGIKVLLIDKARFPRDKTCGDALTPRAVTVLDGMGLLPTVQSRAWQINGVNIVAPRGHRVVAAVPHSKCWLPYMLVLPRFVLDDTLRRRAIEAGADFQGQLQVKALAQAGDGVAVTGEAQGQTVRFNAQALILATGANSTLLLQVGLLQRRPVMALAARAYYEDVYDLSDQIDLRFDGVPLPGYGWMFPVGQSSANLGLGLFPTRWASSLRRQLTATAAFEAFIQTPALQARLRGARRIGPIKGFPLRVDFPGAPTTKGRIMLVGEAAGLVNPLTGEGIDYALESGKLAGEHLATLFRTGQLSPARIADYDRLLHARFARLFHLYRWTRRLFVNPLLLNRMVQLANEHTYLKLKLVNLVLGTSATAPAIQLALR
ncbi:MAG: geranylgeranyl reductase family protein [Herpetosiphonaceae bacterium]|nr:geranylgeranyl reductase family protein [Herpetosiphonaceae bacterium]